MDAPSGTATLARAAAPLARGWLRRGLGLAAAATTALVLVAFLGGFGLFVIDVSQRAAPADPRADAIVVLTGGAARIDSALQLLADGRAGRLLISGVNPIVGQADLAGIIERDKRPLLDCCIDLDHEAKNTIGNAVSAGQWARERGYGSLIVVTSNYHMARSLAELSRTLPDTRLVAYPIGDGATGLADLLGKPRSVRLLLEEYVKYLGARIRLMVEPSPASPTRLARTATQ